MSTSNTVVSHVVIYKDLWVASKPWYADLHLKDGTVMKQWQSMWKTKKEMMKQIRSSHKGDVFMNGDLVTS